MGGVAGVFSRGTTHMVAWNLDTYTGKDNGMVRVVTHAQKNSILKKPQHLAIYLGTMLPQHSATPITGDNKLLPRPHAAAVQYSSGSAVLRGVPVEEFVNLHDLLGLVHVHPPRRSSRGLQQA